MDAVQAFLRSLIFVTDLAGACVRAVCFQSPQIFAILLASPWPLTTPAAVTGLASGSSETAVVKAVCAVSLLSLCEPGPLQNFEQI
ncbi:unnamed protein product [Symbiodinium sp. KB8]|nr:unnamed protein product [Symbiodinium sp. KB8]